MEDLGLAKKDLDPSAAFRGRRILVTGAGGFIGSHLTHRLVDLGGEVHVLVRRPAGCWRLESIRSGLQWWTADLTDHRGVKRCVREIRPQVVFHLAALRDVRRDAGVVEAMFSVNATGSVHLLMAAAASGTLETFVNTGSSEEYGDIRTPFSEDDREAPVSPYSASKVAVTHFCTMAARSLGLPVVTVRPFLTYGPAQDPDMFIPSLVLHCLRGEDYPMTAGDQTREFTYVDDMVEGILRAAACREAVGKVLNLGTGKEYTILEVSEKVVGMTGHRIRLLVGALPKRPGETDHFCADTAKAGRLLGWTPAIPLEEGLARTIAYYREHRGQSSRPISLLPGASIRGVETRFCRGTST